jgi:hypothetical protein
LVGYEVNGKPSSLSLCFGFDVGEGGGAIDFWLPSAQEIEIGAVDEEDS